MRSSYEVSDLDGRIVLLKLDGECNIEDCSKISDIFNEIIASQKYNIIILMENVTFISSPFLGKLMGCKLRLKERDGNLIFVDMGYQVREKLTMMGANRVFKFFSDLRSAYNFFQWEFNENSQVMQFTLPASLHAIPPVRRLVSRISMQKGYFQKDAFRIETIVDEIANNAIEHAAKGQSSVTFEFKVDKKHMSMSAENRAEESDFQKLRQLLDSPGKPDSDTDFRGRGIALVKLISSSMKVEYKNGMVRVMVKKEREALEN